MIASLATRELVLDVLLLVLDLIGLVVGSKLLGRRSVEDATLLRDVTVMLAFALGWTALTTTMVALGLHTRFGALRAATHAAVFVVAPIAIGRGVLHLVAGRAITGLVGLLCGLVVACTYAWAHFVEPYRLEVSTHRIATPRASQLARPLRVAVLADVQTDAVGGWEEHVFRTVAAAKPDLLLLAGDYVQQANRERFVAECARFRALFELLEPWPPLGVLAVIGDVDPDQTIFQGTRVRLLRDETASFALEPRLQVIGLTLASSRRAFDSDSSARIDGFDGYSIVLGHAPDHAIPVIDGTRRTEALFVAGHTHGGQIVVPGFGPPMTLSRVPRAVAAGGLHAYGDARVCVSRGTGLERGMAPRVRLFCRPELVVFEIGPDS